MKIYTFLYAVLLAISASPIHPMESPTKVEKNFFEELDLIQNLPELSESTPSTVLQPAPAANTTQHQPREFPGLPMPAPVAHQPDAHFQYHVNSNPAAASLHSSTASQVRAPVNSSNYFNGLPMPEPVANIAPQSGRATTTPARQQFQQKTKAHQAANKRKTTAQASAAGAVLKSSNEDSYTDQESVRPIKKKKQGAQALFQCELCDRALTRKNDLKRHHKKVHDESRSFKCNKYKCEKSFPTKDELRSHKISHSNDRPYACTECEKTYKQKHHLEDHINELHRKEKKYKCEKCQEGFIYRRALTRHLKKCQPEENDGGGGGSDN